MSRNIHATHVFTCLDDAPFSVKDYSLMKFGHDEVARKFGYDLAESFFDANRALVIGQPLVVFASPYNYVKNAATIMTKHFVDRLNMLSVFHSGHAVEYSVVHRKISYTNDYGFLSAEERKRLIDGDSFSINKHFVEGKTLLFIDDVRITGTHEHKLVELLDEAGIKLSTAHFLYHANLVSDTIHPGIEAKLNFASVARIADFVEIAHSDGHHMIIRPIKYILSLSEIDMLEMMECLPAQAIIDAYFGANAEGYFKVPSYQRNFAILKQKAERLLGAQYGII
jgi:hypothetical protein